MVVRLHALGSFSAAFRTHHLLLLLSHRAYVQLNALTSLVQLPYRVRWQDLKDLFRKAGTVLRADVSLGPDNRSRGYGTVLLATGEDAGRAIDMFNGYSWQTRILEVRPDRLPPDLDLQASMVPNSGLSSPMGAFGPSLTPMQPSFHREDSGGSVPRAGSSTTNQRTLFVGNVRALC
jgi:hypothetical protein